MTLCIRLREHLLLMEILVTVAETCATRVYSVTDRGGACWFVPVAALVLSVEQRPLVCLRGSVVLRTLRSQSDGSPFDALLGDGPPQRTQPPGLRNLHLVREDVALLLGCRRALS